MTRPTNLETVLRVLAVSETVQRAELHRLRVQKNQLRAQQVDLVAARELALSKANSLSALPLPSNLYGKKLLADQRRILTPLSQNAMHSHDVENSLRKLAQQRLALEAKLAVLQAKPTRHNVDQTSLLSWARSAFRKHPGGSCQ